MKKPTTEQRFWSHVNKTSSCWLWTGSKRNKGYGAFVWADRGLIVQGRAHRYSWELVHGKIPAGMCCLHRCDVPACVNPSHLWLGTKAENNRDMCAKGRHAKAPYSCVRNHTQKYVTGSAHHAAKITPEIARKIRADKKSLSYSQLSKKYSLAIGNLWRIVNGVTWKE